MTQLCNCGKPTAGATMCDDCATTFAYAIANVAAYYPDLETVATKRTRNGGIATRGSVGKTQPLPVDLRFVDSGPAPDDDKSGRPRPATLAPGAQLKWDTWNTVVAWCGTVMAGQRPLAGPVCDTDCLHVSCANTRRRRHPRNTITSMIHYIARQYRWILTQPFAAAMMDEFLDLERRLKRMVDSAPSRWYAGRCTTPTGDADNVCTAELYATTDRGTITCPGCGTRHDVASRRDFLLNEAKDYLVTATEAAGALLAWTDYDGSETKLVDRIGKWRDRRRVETHGTVKVAGRDRDLYRLGDLQDLLVADAQTQQTKRIGAAS